MSIWNFLVQGASTEILPHAGAEGATLESIDHEELAEIGRFLHMALTHAARIDSAQSHGLLDFPTNGLSQLMNAIPGLRTLDADAMNAGDVSRLAGYVRSRHPQLFEEMITELSPLSLSAATALQGTREAN